MVICSNASDVREEATHGFRMHIVKRCMLIRDHTINNAIRVCPRKCRQIGGAKLFLIFETPGCSTCCATGLPFKYEDHSLLLSLDGCIDTPVWSLLPYAFAASFSSESWRK